MHETLMNIAENRIAHHLENDDGEICFNLISYLNDLEDQIDQAVDMLDLGLHPEEVAWYLWCCLSLASGCNPSSATFRSMPVLG
jgi:hypothetical protein